MPSVRITNLTPKPINVSLKQLTALHFENNIQPGATVKLKPGKVWFTIEALVDDGKNRYSVMKSAATIGIISLAVGVTAVTAGAALLPDVAILTAMAATSSSAITPHLSRMAIGAKSAIIAHGGTLAKISAQAIPKAITAVTASLGGLSALQREVISILSSPLTPSALRARGFHILSSLRKAHSEDKSRSAEQKARDLEEAQRLDAEARLEEEKGGDEVDEITGELKRSHGVVEDKGLRTDTLVRKHAVFIGERKHFEVRLVAPNLAIYDANGKFFL